MTRVALTRTTLACLLSLAAAARARDILNGCPMEGSARTASTEAENRMKKRAHS